MTPPCNRIPTVADRLLKIERCGQWQPIETAPKDGVTILAFSEPGAYTCYWYDGKETNEGCPGWIDGSVNKYEEFYVYHPTHWMPLPEPPTVDKFAGHTIAELRALHEAANPGPYEVDWDDNGFFQLQPIRFYPDGCPGDEIEKDLTAIAAARNALPELLDEIEALRARVTELQAK